MTDKDILEAVLPDPVLSAFELPLKATFYPYGFPLELATNSRHVMRAAEEGWGMFRQQFEASPARFHVGVVAGRGGPLPEQSTVRSRENLMVGIADAENFFVCDFRQNFGYAWMTEAIAADHAAVRYRFLTAGGLTLLEKQHLAALHCGLVVRNGSGVALFGDSLAGKSTLSYACARAGWTFVSDDGAYLVRNRSDRYAAGDPYALHLREDAKTFFPELQDHMPTSRPNGKVGIEVLTHDLPMQVASGCTVDHIVFLNRSEPGPVRLRRYPLEDVLRWCERYVTFGPARVQEAQIRAYQRLLSAGLWELRYRDLDEAVARLERLADTGE